ncbi:MAG: GIY-YIG nuclease family protein [Chloroflexi bacterium]|nr:GIY-YIG nuclease family protein [Chloroflexota bacterium]
MVKRRGPPDEVAAILRELIKALDVIDPANGRKVGDAKYGVYAFFDYDDEPIYVGQTTEQLRVRIRRHLTNQRTDAVAMNVLDPFEVADVEMWPFWDLHDAWQLAEQNEQKAKVREWAKERLNSAEYSLFQSVLDASQFGAVLNEKPPDEAEMMELPSSFRRRIVPPDIYRRRVHPDIRIAQRAATIARLADVISRRQVKPGLRATLVVQAKRLLHLSESRLREVE